MLFLLNKPLGLCQRHTYLKYFFMAGAVAFLICYLYPSIQIREYLCAGLCVRARSLSLSHTYIYTYTCWLVYEILLSTYENTVTLRVT